MARSRRSPSSDRSHSVRSRSRHASSGASRKASLRAIVPIDLMWALIGLILTIGGTFLEAFITGPPMDFSTSNVSIQSLGVTCQIGAVLLIGCVGGRNAAAMSQIAYLLLGLTWFNVFTDGGGPGYIYQPTFGYLLGFIPGAWVCGFLAFRVPRRLESLAFSCLCGLLTIHITGVSLLVTNYVLDRAGMEASLLWETILHYSIYPFPGQIALICAVTVLSFALRHLLFY
jgi:biotin transport system substrate-specific component